MSDSRPVRGTCSESIPFGPTCPHTGKVSYMRRSDAKTVARRLSKVQRTRVQAYLCTCGYHHVGHCGDRTRAEHREMHGWEVRHPMSATAQTEFDYVEATK